MGAIYSSRADRPTRDTAWTNKARHLIPMNMGEGRSAGKRGPLNSMSEQSKAVTRRLIEELFNTENLEMADEVLAANYVDHSPSHPGLHGQENLKRAVGEWLVAFPDTHNVIEDIVAE